MKPLNLAVLLILLVALALPALAQTTPPASLPCQMCAQPATANPPVTMTVGTTKYSYSDVLCALLDSERRGDGTITAKSAATGKTITITKHGNLLTTKPAGAMMAVLPDNAGQCAVTNLLFGSPAELQAYAKSHPDFVGYKTTPLLRVNDVLVTAHPKFPATATCPMTQQPFKTSDQTPWTVKDGKLYMFCCPNCKQQFNGA